MPRYNAARKQGTPMRQCPLCTYPLRSALMEDGKHKYWYCSNKRCDYNKLVVLRKKR